MGKRGHVDQRLQKLSYIGEINLSHIFPRITIINNMVNFKIAKRKDFKYFYHKKIHEVVDVLICFIYSFHNVVIYQKLILYSRNI
jgi:hypothetical protein